VNFLRRVGVGTPPAVDRHGGGPAAAQDQARCPIAAQANAFQQSAATADRKLLAFVAGDWHAERPNWLA
jgi:hypothetical protein